MIVTAVLFHKKSCYFLYQAVNKEVANNFNELKLMNNITHLDFCIRKAFVSDMQGLMLLFQCFMIEIDLGCHRVAQ